MNNNLLLLSSVSDAPRDRIDSLSPPCAAGGILVNEGGTIGAFLGMASLTCKAETQNAKNKDERLCELFRRNAYRAACGASRVPPCEHVRPQTVDADDTGDALSEQTPMEAPLGKPEGPFHDSILGENGLGLRFRAEFFNIFNHPNFGNPNNSLTSPLFGRSTQTLANSLGSGGANGGFNPLYQIGGPRSIQLALKLQF
jgi:hypothetical protein